METRANYIAVGLFTLIAILGMMATVYWYGRYGEADNLRRLDIRIQGSVSGLGKGSIVQFNGITVGRVTDLRLDENDPRFVVVQTAVNPATPVREDTRASLGIRGLSGGAFIELEGGSPQKPALLADPPPDGTEAPIISGDPSALSDLIARVNVLALRADRVFNTLEGFVNENSKTVSTTLKNAETFSDALAKNSDGVAKFLKSAGEVATSLESLSTKLDGSVAQAEKILKAVDPDSVSKTVKNVEQFTTELQTQRAQIAAALKSVNEAASNINTFSKDLNTTLSRADKVVAAVDPKRVSAALANFEKATANAEALLKSVDSQQVSKAVEDVAATAKAARGILENVDQNTVKTLISDLSSASKNISQLTASIDAAKVNSAVENIGKAAEGAQKVVADVSKVTGRFGERGSDVDQIITNARDLTANLNRSSQKIDGLIANIDKLVGSDTANGLASDVRATLAQFRQTARNLDASVAAASQSFNAFTKRGLSNTQTLIRDAQQSINRIDRVIRNLEANPSALITGAGGNRIRETRIGRPRR